MSCRNKCSNDSRVSLREAGSKDSNNRVEVHQRMKIQTNEWGLMTASTKAQSQAMVSTGNGRDREKRPGEGRIATRENVGE